MNKIKEIFNKIFLNQNLCPFCEKDYSSKNMLCPKCTSIIEKAKKQEFCRKCGKFIVNNNDIQSRSINGDYKNNQGTKICKFCLDEEPYFYLSRGVTSYEGVVKENIYKFKYHGQRSLAKIMAKLMVDKAIGYTEYLEIDCIVPVPIAKEKIEKRRYNHAYLLAKEIGKIINKPVIVNNLVRVINTPAQSKLTKKAREVNLTNAFEILHPLAFAGKKVLLIDDILTTGSTANECSRVLKEKEATLVLVLTLVTGKTTWNGGKGHGYSKL